MRTRSKSRFAWMAWLNRNACEKVQGKSAMLSRHWSTQAVARKQEAIALLRIERKTASATPSSPTRMHIGHQTFTTGFHDDLGFSSTTAYVGVSQPRRAPFLANLGIQSGPPPRDNPSAALPPWLAGSPTVTAAMHPSRPVATRGKAGDVHDDHTVTVQI